MNAGYEVLSWGITSINFLSVESSIVLFTYLSYDDVDISYVLVNV